ncbi:MAG: type II toxin-antitoxin system VapC family toxin [Alphaproteobacteria bacterium]|nr:type II toxin-antitoxin system VapC family toxin [Alphaproteobacteria bacterium]
MGAAGLLRHRVYARRYAQARIQPTVEHCAGGRFHRRARCAPTCEVVRPGGAFIDRLLAAAHEADARGNLMFDAQIVALCREHGVDEVLTNDRDFARFDGLRMRRLD